MSLINGFFNSLLSVLNVTPEEAQNMVQRVVTSVDNVDKRLARIEHALGLTAEIVPFNQEREDDAIDRAIDK